MAYFWLAGATWNLFQTYCRHCFCTIDNSVVCTDDGYDFMGVREGPCPSLRQSHDRNACVGFEPSGSSPLGKKMMKCDMTWICRQLDKDTKSL